MAVNLDGSFLGCKHAVRHMKQHGGGGAIVNISSVGSLKGSMTGPAYGASKAAVWNLTRIYPVEVEEALRQHPGVLDACVVGQPDARWGEIVVAVVETRPGVTLSEDELREHARTRIAGYKCPKVVRFGPLPRTASGKLQRAELRKRLKEAVVA